MIIFGGARNRVRFRKYVGEAMAIEAVMLLAK